MLQVYLSSIREHVGLLLDYVDEVDELEVFLGSDFMALLRKVYADSLNILSDLDFD